MTAIGFCTDYIADSNIRKRRFRWIEVGRVRSSVLCPTHPKNVAGGGSYRLLAIGAFHVKISPCWQAQMTTHGIKADGLSWEIRWEQDPAVRALAFGL